MATKRSVFYNRMFTRALQWIALPQLDAIQFPVPDVYPSSAWIVTSINLIHNLTYNSVDILSTSFLSLPHFSILIPYLHIFLLYVPCVSLFSVPLFVFHYSPSSIPLLIYSFTYFYSFLS